MKQIVDKSKWTLKIKCANCGTTAWRKMEAMVCYKCYYNKNCPNWLKRTFIRGLP